LRAVVTTENELVAAGSFGGYVRSIDGGQTWTEGRLASEETVFSLCWNGTELLAVGGRGAVATSTDGGESWTEHCKLSD
jgi:photosystem II stability/assembly factor-like uncharacterized protein